MANSDSDISELVPTLHDFRIRRILGQGGFAKVVLVRHRPNPTNFYALKCIQKERVCQDTLLAERNLLIKLQSRFTTRLFATFQSDTHVFFLMEKLYIDLFEVVLDMTDGPLPEDWARFYIGQLAMAVEFLHSRGVIHRDIKLENVLLDKAGYLRLADFGLANQGMRATTFVGTPDYLAPEVVAGKEYGKAVDWWAIGVILYVMLSKLFPFASKNEDQLKQSIGRAQYSCIRNVSKSGRGLLRGLLTKCPHSRTQSFRTVRAHRWFRDFQWSGISERTSRAPVIPPSNRKIRLSERDKLELVSWLEIESESSDLDNDIPNFDFVAADF